MRHVNSKLKRTLAFVFLIFAALWPRGTGALTTDMELERLAQSPSTNDVSAYQDKLSEFERRRSLLAREMMSYSLGNPRHTKLAVAISHLDRDMELFRIDIQNLKNAPHWTKDTLKADAEKRVAKISSTFDRAVAE